MNFAMTPVAYVRAARATPEDDFWGRTESVIELSEGFSEDSLAGIEGALAAGMTVLGFHGGSHCGPGYADKLRAAGAALVFDDMRELPDLVRKAGQKPGLIAGFSAG